MSLMLIDEAARAPDELYRAMRPSLAVGDGDLWLMSTPNGRRGFFWEEWEMGGPEWERICGRLQSVRGSLHGFWGRSG